MHFRDSAFVLSSGHNYCFWYYILHPNCFLYPSTVYRGCKWFYYFCLLTSLLATCTDDFLPLLYSCLWKWKWKWSHSVVANSLWPHGLQPTRLLCPWNFPGKSTGVGCHFLLQGIFPTQGSNLGLPHCRQTLYHLSHKGSPFLALLVNFSIL